MNNCYICETTESELRPYGVNGAWVCFSCAMLPDQIEITNAQFEQQLEASLLQSDTVILGEQTGPRPGLPRHPH